MFLESLVTNDNTSKFRVIGGQILVGNTTHDIVFGKARSSSSGPSGEKDSMVLSHSPRSGNQKKEELAL